MSKFHARLATALIGLVAITFPSSAAFADQPETAVEALAAELIINPGGTVLDNTIVYDDGTIFVAVAAGTMSVGQCTSNKFCIWGLTNYRGSFKYKTGSGVTYSLSGTVGSFWNNRSTVAKLYNNSGSASTCYENGVKKASVGSSYSAADKVYLASGTSC